jgi:coatomer subunit beta
VVVGGESIVKQVDELIVFRQLKKQQLYDIDLGDEEVAEDVFQSKSDEQTYVQRLSHLVQLTGYGDPIYAEAYVNIHKYDISFEVFLVNRTPKMVQNV